VIHIPVAIPALFVLMSYGGWTESEHQRVVALLERTFPEASRFVDVAIPLDSLERDSVHALSRQHFPDDTLHLVIAMDGDQRLGYAALDHVMGKDQPITYCLIVDSTLSVCAMAILAYREPYGGEVQNTSWLRQFFGKQPGDALRPGREIKNITGATISARAITSGVKKLLVALRLVEPRLPLRP
jgi:hypothetical protein